MKQVSQSVTQSKAELMRYRKAPQFAPAGQSTQMIIGASPETDYQILRLTEGLYQKYSLKRVFFSAYIPVAEDSLLPALDTKPPLLREHRAVSGRLAAALLPVFRLRDPRRAASGLQSLPGPQMQLGRP